MVWDVFVVWCVGWVVFVFGFFLGVVVFYVVGRFVGMGLVFVVSGFDFVDCVGFVGVVVDY